MAESSARLSIRLIPRASREAVAGQRDGAIVVRVTAAPVDGAANDALLRLLAKRLRVPRTSLRIASGATSRSKAVEVRGIDEAEALRRLGVSA